MTTSTLFGRKVTARFEQRLGKILDVASRQMNEVGVRGMTLTAVAAELKLDTSSLTYYFRKKEDLAVACLHRSIERQNQAATEAVLEPDVRSAVRSFVGAHFDANRANIHIDAPVLVLLSDLQSMAPEPRERLYDLYAQGQHTLRGCFERSPFTAMSLIASTVLLSACHWLPGWVLDHSERDYKRLEGRLLDLFDSGLEIAMRQPLDGPIPNEPNASAATARFLHAATILINRDGYHGASVEKIAAEMGVSTGSFYHHLDNKDELVMACFDRSCGLMEQAQIMAEERGGNAGERLATMVASLLRLQFAGTNPLLRTSAYQALPPLLRDQLMRRFKKITLSLAGLVADGVADRSVRATDPLVAANYVLSLITAAGELRNWAARTGVNSAVASFALLLGSGIYGVHELDGKE